MRVKLTQNYITKLKAKVKPYDIYDDAIRWLFVRISPNGKKNWHLRYGHRTAKLGPADILSPGQARDKAQNFLAEFYSTGISPKDKNTKSKVSTIGELLKEYNEAGHSEYLTRRICPHFSNETEIEKITIINIEKWRKEYIKTHKAATGNRIISALRALLNWGEKRGLCINTLKGISMLPETDSISIVRYLAPDEQKRLLDTLKSFDLIFQAFILTALNTGIRKNALLNLKWNDLNFDDRTILLRATIAKSRKSSILPMNDVVYDVLKNLPHIGEYVFTNPVTKNKYYDLKKPWLALLKKADIQNFRFHDLRHNFASQLVMKGVDLNTVRELMTHSDIQMTMRYAHLAPNIKQNAVNLLTDLTIDKYKRTPE